MLSNICNKSYAQGWMTSGFLFDFDELCEKKFMLKDLMSRHRPSYLSKELAIEFVVAKGLDGGFCTISTWCTVFIMTL